jgi:hypothetical protein
MYNFFVISANFPQIFRKKKCHAHADTFAFPAVEDAQKNPKDLIMVNPAQSERSERVPGRRETGMSAER